MNGILIKADAFLASIYPDYKRFFKYMGVGVIGTLAEWTVFYVLITSVNIFYLAASPVSYLVGAVINFFLNKYLTFDNHYKKIHFQFLSFAIVAMIGLGLNIILLNVFVEYIFDNSSSLYIMASKMIVTFIVFIWNFAANKRTTFRIFR